MMGGSYVEDDWELASSGSANEVQISTNDARTVVLVGRTGNGKSATGNTILGKKVFKSRASSSGVTSSCEMKTAKLSDGQIVNVIDTPGLFEVSAGSEFIGKEIVKCIDFAKDGIHAILVVLSVRSRFSEEEENALRSLQTLFGSKIVDYMIVVFTGGDELEDDEDTLDDYLGRECPESLKQILSLCGNRRVLFDNKTKDEKKRSGQVQQLLSFVNLIVSQNGGQPYTDELYTELKEGAMKLHNQQRKVDSLEGHSEGQISELKKHMQQTYEDQLNFAVHTDATTSTGNIASIPSPFTAAGCIFEAKVVGVGGHAAFPHLTVNQRLLDASFEILVFNSLAQGKSILFKVKIFDRAPLGKSKLSKY